MKLHRVIPAALAALVMLPAMASHVTTATSVNFILSAYHQRSWPRPRRGDPGPMASVHIPRTQSRAAVDTSETPDP